MKKKITGLVYDTKASIETKILSDVILHIFFCEESLSEEALSGNVFSRHDSV